jgi:hypothetical protein
MAFKAISHGVFIFQGIFFRSYSRCPLYLFLSGRRKEKDAASIGAKKGNTLFLLAYKTIKVNQI